MNTDASGGLQGIAFVSKLQGLLATMRRRFRGQLLRSWLWVSSASVLNLLLGYVREATLAYFYGTSAMLDCFYVAWAIPQTIGRQAVYLSIHCLVPIYARAEATRRLSEFWPTFARWGLGLLGFCLVVFVVCLVNGRALAEMVAPELPEWQVQLVARLLVALMGVAGILALSGLPQALAHSRHWFSLPTASWGLLSVGLIFAGALAGRSGSVFPLAYGAAAGGVAVLLVNIWTAWRAHGHCPWRTLNAQDPSVPPPEVVERRQHRSVHRNKMAVPFGPAAVLLVYSGLLLLQRVIDNYCAARLAPGTVSALNYAVMLGAIPSMTIGQTLGVVIFPRIASSHAKQQHSHARKLLRLAFWTALAATSLAAAMCILFAEPIVRVLLARGAFQQESVSTTAYALNFVAVSMIFGAVRGMFLRDAMARQHLRRILMAGIGAMTTKLAFLWIAFQPLGLASIPLSNAVMHACALLVFLMCIYMEGTPIDSVSENAS